MFTISPETHLIVKVKVKKKKMHHCISFCGADETRTRDPMRDRHVF